MACKQRKKKCDGARPCARCTNLGISFGDDASPPESLALPMSQSCWTFAMPEAGPPMHCTAERGILNQFLEFGRSKEAVDMFNHLPARLRQALVASSLVRNAFAVHLVQTLVTPQSEAAFRHYEPGTGWCAATNAAGGR
eukprot:1677739-Rhodomonas_salina.2